MTTPIETTTRNVHGMTAPIEVPVDRGASRSSAILITGAGGEVGHGLIAALHAAGRTDVVAVDIRELDSDVRSMTRESLVGDVCDPAMINRLLATFEITEIYHLAALLSTRAEFTPETAHDVNVGGTMNLLRFAAEQARSHGTRVKFIYPSSIAVYGMSNLAEKARAGAVTEYDLLKPRTMYGCNKLYGEQLGRYYGKYYRQLAQDRTPNLLDFRCIRYPGLISSQTLPSGGTSDFAPEMIHAAAAGKPYACFVREDAQIPFMTMPDAIEATLQLAAAPADKLTKSIYNISAFNPTAGEIAARVKQGFPAADITFEPDLARQAIIDSWPADVDCTAARNDWDFAPKHDFDRAFDEYLIPEITKRYK